MTLDAQEVRHPPGGANPGTREKDLLGGLHVLQAVERVSWCLPPTRKGRLRSVRARRIPLNLYAGLGSLPKSFGDDGSGDIDGRDRVAIRFGRSRVRFQAMVPSGSRPVPENDIDAQGFLHANAQGSAVKIEPARRGIGDQPRNRLARELVRGQRMMRRHGRSQGRPTKIPRRSCYATSGTSLPIFYLPSLFRSRWPVPFRYFLNAFLKTSPLSLIRP